MAKKAGRNRPATTKKKSRQLATPEPPPVRQLRFKSELSPEEVKRLLGPAPSPEEVKRLLGPAPSPEEVERLKAEQKQRDEDRKIIDRALLAREQRPVVNVTVTDARERSPERPLKPQRRYNRLKPRRNPLKTPLPPRSQRTTASALTPQPAKEWAGELFERRPPREGQRRTPERPPKPQPRRNPLQPRRNPLKSPLPPRSQRTAASAPLQESAPFPQASAPVPQAKIAPMEWLYKMFKECPKPLGMESTAYAEDLHTQMKRAAKVRGFLEVKTIMNRRTEWLKELIEPAIKQEPEARDSEIQQSRVRGIA